MSQPQPATQRAIAWALALVLFSSLFAFGYWGIFNNSFHFDDYLNITDHAPVHIDELSLDSLWAVAQQGFKRTRPLSNISFAIDWYRDGGDVIPFLQTNLMIHALNTVLVFLLMLRIFSAYRSQILNSRHAALLCAGLWSLHPIQVQAVTFVVQRMTSLATLFVLLSSLCYLTARRRHDKLRLQAYLGCGLFFIAAVLCKEIAAIIPVLLLLLELGVVRQSSKPTPLTVRERISLSVPVAVFFVIMALYLSGFSALSFFGSYEYRDFTAYERLLTAPRVVVFHLSQMALPTFTSFAIDHDLVHSSGIFSPVGTFISLVGLLGVTGAAVYYFVTRRSLSAFFLLWFFACFLIEGTFIPLELVFEHRMYLPSIGIIGFVVLQVAPHLKRTWRSIPVGYVAMAVVAAFLSWNTSRLVRVWHSDITLYEHAIKVSPRSARAHSNLGKAYWESDAVPAAIQNYEMAVELDPDFDVAMHNLARAYQRTKQSENAMRIYLRLLERSPANSDYLFSVGLYNLELGKHQQAASYFRQALHYKPDHQRARLFLDYVERGARSRQGAQ